MSVDEHFIIRANHILKTTSLHQHVLNNIYQRQKKYLQWTTIGPLSNVQCVTEASTNFRTGRGEGGTSKSRQSVY